MSKNIFEKITVQNLLDLLQVRKKEIIEKFEETELTESKLFYAIGCNDTDYEIQKLCGLARDYCEVNGIEEGIY